MTRLTTNYYHYDSTFSVGPDNDNGQIRSNTTTSESLIDHDHYRHGIPAV